ncbi:MAG: hypothetical protein AB4080_02060 [Trichodesmium sp.]
MIFVILRLVAIATYLVLTYGTVNRPVINYKFVYRNLKEERPKFSSEIDNSDILLTDGTYLFGQSPQPLQIQNEYFVFQIKKSKVIGAVYFPHSAFYCFYGIHQENQLQVKVIDSYDNNASDYTVNLTKYYQIDQVSENDLRILNVCLTNYQNLVW